MFETLKSIVSVLGTFGIPTIFAICVHCYNQVRKFGKKMEILMKAQQAQMRAQLLADYHSAMRDGFISEDDLQEWENQYQSYHELGQNGVLDVRREQLMQLPNSNPKEV